MLGACCDLWGVAALDTPDQRGVSGVARIELNYSQSDFVTSHAPNNGQISELQHFDRDFQNLF